MFIRQNVSIKHVNVPIYHNLWHKIKILVHNRAIFIWLDFIIRFNVDIKSILNKWRVELMCMWHFCAYWSSYFWCPQTLTKNVIFNVLNKKTIKMPPHIWPNLTKSCNNYSLILNELHIKVLIYNYSPIIWYNFHNYS